MNDEQFLQHGMGLLQKELGLEGLARFLRTYRQGAGDCTQDRHKWLQEITFDEICQDIAKLKERSA